MFQIEFVIFDENSKTKKKLYIYLFIFTTQKLIYIVVGNEVVASKILTK